MYCKCFWVPINFLVYIIGVFFRWKIQSFRLKKKSSSISNEKKIQQNNNVTAEVSLIIVFKYAFFYLHVTL